MISAFNGISLDLPAIKTLYNEFITRDLFKSPPVISESFKSSLISEIKSIEIKDLSFSYDTSGPILINANLKIDQGDFVGLVGQSGEGKTTLIDLILGIRKPIDGDILVNGYSIHSALESWRSKIAYLPQEIFIINGTVAENVALGIRKEEIDDLFGFTYDFLDDNGNVIVTLSENANIWGWESIENDGVTWIRIHEHNNLWMPYK